jgi:hypothetical protein
MKSIAKIGGITVATLLTLTIVSITLMESAYAQANQDNRGRVNQQNRDNCRENDSVVGVCVGGVNANIPVNANVEVSCSVLVLVDRCQANR